MATPKTLLQIINQAQGILGLPMSASIIGNTTDFSAIQFLALANEAGEEIRDTPEEGWVGLQTEFNLVVTPPITTTCNTTTNSPIITNIASGTSALTAGAWVASANSLPQAARILTINSPSSVTMTMEASGNTTNSNIIFAQDTYPIASDFKAYIGDTWWDRTNHWRLFGPDSPQTDQWHRSGIVATGPRRHWRQLGHAANVYRLWPPPFEIVNPLQLAFEYNSTDFVNLLGTNLATSAMWTNDTDTSYLDDRLIIKWISWKYQAYKGFAFDLIRNDAIDFMKTLIARDGGNKPIGLAARDPSIFLSPYQIQDGYFPSPST